MSVPAKPERPRETAAEDVTRLHRRTTGHGPAILFVHGMADDCSVWAGAVAALGEEYASTLIDLPGHGHSPAPEEPRAYERESLLRSLDAVLAETGPAVLVGHSLGGYLGLAHCVTRPGVLRGLVLVAAGPGFRDPDARRKWNERVRVSAKSLAIPAVAATVGLHSDSMVIDRLSALTVPTAVLVGSEDKGFIAAADYFERTLPDVRRRTVSGARHRLMLTHPHEVARAVEGIVAAAARAAYGSQHQETKSS